jgi:hypothetical protein
MEELQEDIAEILSHCIDKGMKLPLILCSIGINGSVLVVRVNDGREPDTLAEYLENDAFNLPINIMVIDRDGEAARVVINGGVISYH